MLKLEHIHASIRHLQANEQQKVANKTILNGLKKRLDALHGKWTGELENALWALNTTPKRETRETLFSLVYSSEAVALMEITVASHRVKHFKMAMNDNKKFLKLDPIDEKDGRLSKCKEKCVLSRPDIITNEYPLGNFWCGIG